MKIGFIGLGIMGKPMVKNLIKAGEVVLVHSRTQASVDEVVADGAIPSNIAEIGRECGMVITMLPDGPDVEQVVLGAGGLLENAKEGLILVDMSSIAPAISQKIHDKCAEKGVKMLDAPVSGGQPGAINGTLSIMVGGDGDLFERVRPILLKMGASAVHCGEIGAGNTTKLANNIIVAMNIAAVCEAFTLSTKAGVDAQKVFEAIKGGLAGSAVLNAKIPMILDGNFNPGFKIDLHIKDLQNAVNTGQEVGCPLPFTGQTIDIYRQLSKAGHGQKDHSGMWLYWNGANE
ncbi:MAG: 2-hydroxy-3-oxopropionate reductase [Defluviitaleaceae bacterium]|nr:2-hydroxy-3-oxopropionate reductase [Defluviitaleaceae bacterium]